MVLQWFDMLVRCEGDVALFCGIVGMQHSIERSLVLHTHSCLKYRGVT